MILFVFEGEDREPHIYRTLERLYFPRNNNNVICSFGNNIYELYNEMKTYEGDGDVFSVIKQRYAESEDSVLKGLRRSDISEIYLFFDYDFQHNHLSLDEINERVEEMLKLFDDETGQGKLYINYPMVESIRYTKELPDSDYCGYNVSRFDCRDFKKLVHQFSYYSNFDHILFRDNEKPDKERYLMIQDNWSILKEMNVCKANWLITDSYSMPGKKSEIGQMSIFRSQKEKYVDKEERISVLNSFPIFLYEYFK